MARAENVIPLSEALHETFFTEFQGKEFLPPVLNQRDFNIALNDGQCMSVCTGEVMQAKLNLRAIKRDEPPPPTLSIQQLVDATTPKPANYIQAVFSYLMEQGLVTTSAYDAAVVPNDGTRLRNVQGLRTHKIAGFKNYYCGPQNLLREPDDMGKVIDDLVSFGPLIGDLLVTHELIHYKGGIIKGNNFVLRPVTERVLSHAAAIVGFGITTDDTLYWIMRNNWGEEFGDSGIFRIAMSLVSDVYSIQVNHDESEGEVRRSGRKRSA